MKTRQRAGQAIGCRGPSLDVKEAHVRKFDSHGGSFETDGNAFDDIRNASCRLADAGRGGGGLSTHEYNAAAIVNGRLDLLEQDFRMTLIAMGPDWAHAVIAAIFDNWERELTLPADHADAPHGDQRLINRRQIGRFTSPAFTTTLQKSS
jgi:hypothetical protein